MFRIQNYLAYKEKGKCDQFSMEKTMNQIPDVRIINQRLYATIITMFHQMKINTIDRSEYEL